MFVKARLITEGIGTGMAGSHGAVTAGAVAGFVEAVAVHPLDMIKTRSLSLVPTARHGGPETRRRWA